MLGKEHPDTLTSVNNLARAVSGRAATARPSRSKARPGSSERLLGQEHPDTLATVNNLASSIKPRAATAKPSRFWRALRPASACWARSIPIRLPASTIWRKLYQRQGRYSEAEPLYRRALEARERVLGTEHPDTLISVNNLAALYQAQGR